MRIEKLKVDKHNNIIATGYIMCPKCGHIERRQSTNSKYCGSIIAKTGCSYLNYLNKHKEQDIKRRKDPFKKELRKAAQKNGKKTTQCILKNIQKSI